MPNTGLPNNIVDVHGMSESNRRYPHSRYRGVCWDAGGRRWRAYLGRQYLGLYQSEWDAALAAYQARQRHRYRFTEDPEVEVLADFFGPVPLTRRWSWKRQ